MTRIGLRLDPLDTLFFRDGRPFDAATRVAGGLPLPRTLAGALRTYLLSRAGFDLGALARARRSRPDEPVREVLLRLGAPPATVELSFRGPWLALPQADGTVAPVLPAPATLAVERNNRDRERDRYYRADPLRGKLPGWPADGGRLPLWRRDGPDAKPADGFLTPAGVAAFLAGGVPAPEDCRRAEDLYAFDQRTGIAIDPGTLTAAEGNIYGIRLLALRPGVCLYAEVLGAGADRLPFTDPLPLGGEGRHVRVQPVAAHTWPQVEPNEGRAAWLLASPALLAGPGAVPEVPPPARLVAAASGTPLAVSGWDVARGGPHPTRFAVPAGSVYFVEGSFSPPRQSLSADAEDAAQGWGFTLRGTWNHV